MEEDLHKILKEITDQIGFGYRENIYQNALVYDLREKYRSVEKEINKDVIYNNHVLGNVRIDILVDRQCIIEMKCLVKITEKEVNQLKRYLQLFKCEIGYLININTKGFEVIEVAK